MKFASVKQAVKFCIGASLPSDKQTSVKCQPLPPPPPTPLTINIFLVFLEYRATTVIDTNCNYFVITYKSILIVDPIFHFNLYTLLELNNLVIYYHL
jgi:hypothetical protein